jgi:hypothetical protein
VAPFALAPTAQQYADPSLAPQLWSERGCPPAPALQPAPAPGSTAQASAAAAGRLPRQRSVAIEQATGSSQPEAVPVVVVKE